MRILKILNNNVIIAKNESGKEVVVMKLGLGFHKKAGDPVPKTSDLKVFELIDEAQTQYNKLMLDINQDALMLAEETITYAANEKKLQLNDIIHLTLADHIDGLLERLVADINMPNQLTMEIRMAYPEEFEIGSYAKKLIEDKTGYQLLIDEAAFIALHFVNCRKDNPAHQEDVEVVAKFIKDVILIVETYFKRKLDETSLSYLRFVRHLKFLIQRIYDDKEYRDDPTLYDRISVSYPDSAKCVNKIARAIELKYRKGLSTEEKAYLTIYVEKLTRD